jgi:hypothetical protein
VSNEKSIIPSNLKNNTIPFKNKTCHSPLGLI